VTRLPRATATYGDSVQRKQRGGGKDPSYPGPRVPIDSHASPFKALVPGLPTYYATHDGVLHYDVNWASPEYDVP
jgi:hypothetical protein